MDGSALFYAPDTGDLERRDVGDEWDAPGAVEVVSLRRVSTLRFYPFRSPRHEGVRPTGRYLEDFLNLEGDEAIESYARRWGPLTWCQHRDTWGIHRLAWPLPGDQPAPEDRVRKRLDEPIDQWRAVMARARAIFNVAGALRDGRPPAATDRNLVEPWSPRRLLEDLPARTEGEIEGAFEGFRRTFGPMETMGPRSELAGALNGWLATSHVAPRLEWWSSSPEYRHRLGGLSAAIAHGLLLAVTGAAGLYSCSNCGKSYLRTKRRTKPGQSNYCDECSNARGWAQGQNRRRRRGGGTS